MWIEQVVNQETLDALDGAIKKWEQIVDGSQADGGIADCPLCVLLDTLCRTCPIAVQTGRRGCYGSPYTDWRGLNDDCEICENGYANCEPCNAAANKLIDWLRELRNHCSKEGS